jgi:NADH-quinone oxidoreductase subunit M
MKRRFPLRALPLFALLAALLSLFLSAAHARAAQPGPPRFTPPAVAGLPGAPSVVAAKHGTVVLSIEGRGGEGQGGGPLALKPKDSGYAGELVITNRGDEPLQISRLAIRGDDDDVRAPAKLAARFTEGGGATATIPAHAAKKVTVTWLPDREPRMRQVFAHVVVTSNDEEAGEVAMGIKAQIPQGLPILTEHALSWITFLPLLGVLAIVFLHLAGNKNDALLRGLTLAITGAQCVLAFWLYATFNPDVTRLDGNDGFQFIEHAVWVRSFNIEYFMGVDGASMPMVLLTAIISFCGAIASYSVEKQLKGYFAMYLLLVTGMMGVFVSLDLFLFYVFWEVMLLPMYFLIGIWGGPRKEYAAIKFFLYTLVGSVFMLLAFLALYLNADRTFLVDGTTVAHTFSIPELMRVAYTGKKLTLFGLSFVKVVWVLLFVCFAIKIPMFPFHTWLPDAHVEAPTAVSVILAGVLLKMGTYGILRINFAILPEGTRWAAGAMVAFGVVNVIYGAFCAMAQDDLKRLVAYSSVSHMGFCLIGLGALTPQGIAACLVQMFSHGIITAMLFTLVGVIYDRAHTRDLRKFGGLAGEMPVYTVFVGFAFMASLGLPGLSGFWGEVLALLGAFPMYRVLTSIAATGVILTAGYHLWALQRMFFGTFRESWRQSPQLEPFGGKFPEITSREIASLAPLAALCFLLGFWPVPLFTLISGGVRDLTSLVNPPGPDQIASLILH